jgi:hypothetical protein
MHMARALQHDQAYAKHDPTAEASGLNPTHVQQKC